MRDFVSFNRLYLVLNFVFLFVITTALHCFLIKTCSLKRFAQSVFILAGDITFPGLFIFVCTRSHVYDSSSYMCDD